MNIIDLLNPDSDDDDSQQEHHQTQEPEELHNDQYSHLQLQEQHQLQYILQSNCNSQSSQDHSQSQQPQPQLQYHHHHDQQQQQQHQQQSSHLSLRTQSSNLRQESYQPDERKLQIKFQQDAERILRLLTCPICCCLFTDPVTLSCGNTFCRSCFHYYTNLRTNSPIGSSTGSRRFCPDVDCGRRHSITEIKTDVIIHNLTDLCRTQLSAHVPIVTLQQQQQQHRLYLQDQSLQIQQQQQILSSRLSRRDDSDEDDHPVQAHRQTILNSDHSQRYSHIIHMSQTSQNHQQPHNQSYVNTSYEEDEEDEEEDPDPDFHFLERHLDEVSDEEDNELPPTYVKGNTSRSLTFIEEYQSSSHTTTTGPAPSMSLAQNLQNLQKTMLSELDCQVCCSLFYDPITTPCGHSFCKPCLTRSLDHNDKCPLCRFHLRVSYTFFTNHPINRTITLLIQTLYPDLYQERRTLAEHELYDNMEDTPIFVCNLVFPKMPCFLHVFEPKYRLMIRRCLETRQRHFGMVLPARNGQQGYSEFGTMLEIRSTEFLADGRSLVETIGSYRFRVLDRKQRDGYHMGRIERIDDIDAEQEARLERQEISAAELHNSDPANTPINEPTTAELINMARDFIEDLRNGGAPWLLQRLNSTYGEMPDDPSDFSFWVASVIPIDEYDKYRLLQLRSVRERLKLINSWISQLREQWWFARGCSIS